jgi:hypothetical protein
MTMMMTTTTMKMEIEIINLLLLLLLLLMMMIKITTTTTPLILTEKRRETIFRGKKKVVPCHIPQRETPICTATCTTAVPFLCCSWSSCNFINLMGFVSAEPFAYGRRKFKTTDEHRTGTSKT